MREVGFQEAGMKRTSTIDKGDTFRDLVVSMLEAAGFAAQSEIRKDYKKVDAIWRRDDIDGPRLYAIEAKDYSATLNKDECVAFAYEYGTLVDKGEIDSAWLVSKGEISPDGRAAVDAKRGLKAFTFAEFQRRLLGLDNYLLGLLGKYQNSSISDWYVPLHTDEDAPLEEVVLSWLEKDDLLPMAIIAGYGKGKSTFALNMAANLAAEALRQADRRAPILIPLGEIMDEQSLEGLLGKAFTTTSGVLNYNFALFEKLNHAGRFVIIFDGFDEMKHGMTLQKFETMIRELLRLDRGRAKILILGRDTAFHDQHEFRAIIEGRQTTSAGFEVSTMDRRQFMPVTIRDFQIDEAKNFVRGFFPSLMAEAAKGEVAVSEGWIDKRIGELVGGEFDTLLVRPVHARMLCQIATDPQLILRSISKYGLFDRFVHFLLDREVNKRGRDQRFGIVSRRKFNCQVALWLWRQAGASTVTLNQIPFQLCQMAVKGVDHDYDELSLRRELTQGCLVDKGVTTVFFNHRSLQEFLVANAIVDMSEAPGFDTKALNDCLGLLNEEIGTFLIGGAGESEVIEKAIENWFPAFRNLHKPQMSVVAMRTVVAILSTRPNLQEELLRHNEPWFRWLLFFVRNNDTSYRAKTPAAVSFISDLINSISSTTPIAHQAAIYTLVASTMRYAITPRTIATWLTPTMIEIALSKTQGKGKMTLAYFQKDSDFLFWLFLKSARITKLEGDVAIEIDVERLRDSAASLSSVDILEELKDGSEQAVITITAQSVYRAWGIPAKRLDKLRPFFNDPSLFARMKPLETDIRTTPKSDGFERVNEAKTARPTLSLKKPAGI